METIQLISIVGGYLFYSLFIMSYFLRKTHDTFTYRIKTITANYNETLYQDYKDKKISPMVYKENKRDYNTEVRIAKRVNMWVSPILAIPVTLTLCLRYLMGD